MPNDIIPNVGKPQVFTGPRALFKVGSTPVGYAGNVSGEETIN
jgi:hypothetical protein